MGASVLLIGGGDVGLKMADGLLRQGGVQRLVIADIYAGLTSANIAMLDCCHESTHVSFETVDGLDARALEKLFRKVKPDLIIQAASLISPWSIIGKDHPTARALNSAGISIQLPAQFPIVYNVMRVVRDLGLSAPVANVSMPDIIHPILATRGMEPTIGLGNASMLHLRVKSALRHQQNGAAIQASLVRVIGHHKQVYDVMQAKPPQNSAHRVRVYIGEEGARHDDLAYQGVGFAPGSIYNVLTAASAMPVLSALLPDARPQRFSAPAPLGLPGGYPVRIDQGTVSIDLPPGVVLEEAIAFNQQIGKLDGVEEIGTDGIVQFTLEAANAVRTVDPSLAEPLDPWNLQNRTHRFMAIIHTIISS